MKFFMEGKGDYMPAEELERKKGPQLTFEDMESQKDEFNLFKEDNLRKQAMQNLREVRQR